MNGARGGLDLLALGALSLFLAAALVALLLVPQRLAQRPARAGVITLLLAADGSLRLWNRPVTPQELAAVLRRAASREPPPVVRLIPDPALRWASLRQVVSRLEQTPLELELQLP